MGVGREAAAAVTGQLKERTRYDMRSGAETTRPSQGVLLLEPAPPCFKNKHLLIGHCVCACTLLSFSFVSTCQWRVSWISSSRVQKLDVHVSRRSLKVLGQASVRI